MTVRQILLPLLLAVAPVAVGGAQTSLTIYNDGRVLIRQTVPARVPAGLSTHRLALGMLEPGSIFAREPGLQITGAYYDASVDEASTMRRAIGRTLAFEITTRIDITRGAPTPVADTVLAEVLGVDPEMFRLADGRVTFRRPGVPRYPEELIQVAPTTTLTVRSQDARQGLPLGWFTGGAQWSAAYEVALGQGDARITGSAVIGSERISADSAEVQLLAGQVGRVPPRPMLRREAMEGIAMAQMAADAASEEAVGETHVYTVPGRLTIRPNTTTRAALFDPATVPVERSYVVPGQVPWVGPLSQSGDEVVPVEVHYLVRRPARTEGFAARPLPAGTWRIYQRDSAGRTQMVGEAASRHTAAGQDVRLPAGAAFDLTARRVQTEYSTRRDSLRTRATAGYRVTIANAKDSAVTVDVLEERRGEWRVLDSSVPADRVSSTQVRFRVRVPANGEAVLTYRVLVIW